jgi:small subunit ribosomal protein S9
MATQNTLVAVGRRKTASARVRLIPSGSGKLTVNERDGDVYLYDAALLAIATSPLRAIETTEKFDIVVRVAGGGPFGQAVAISHGLARALEKFNPEWRAALKKAGLLTRDPRERERKKSGQPGARKRFQFSKR